MDSESLLALLQQVFDDLFDDPPILDESTRLGTDTDIDSLDLIEVSLELEERLGISFDDVDLQELQQTSDVLDVLQKLMSK